MITHLYIEQNGITEEVNSQIIEKLYNLASSGDLDGTSNLKGRLHSSVARDIHVAYLNETFDDLYITADKLYITFTDPQVEQIILNQGWGDGIGVTSQDLGQITTFSGSVFGNSNITSFNEYKYFANATTQGGAFSGCSSLTSIEYPPASTSVGGDAHKNNTSLTHVKIDNTQITSIPNGMFSGCSSLQSITLPATCTSIGRYAFQNCAALSTIDLSNITSLGLHSFNSSGITSADLSSVTNFESNIFDGCSSLQTVVGMSDVTSISQNLFTGCTSLSSADIDFSKVTSIGSGAFSRCSNLVISSLNVPNLTSMGSFAFAYGVKITTIADLGSITLLDAQIFRGCTTLTSVTLPNTITKIKNNVFCDCNNLATINIPTSCTSIANECFAGCSNLDVTLDLSNVTDIGAQAFRGCKKLKISNFPKVSSYGQKTFSNIANTSAIIPKEVVTLNNGAFQYCYNLQTVTFESGSNLKNVRDSVFNNTPITSIVFPEGVENIDGGVFSGCSSLTTIDIPSTIGQIGNAFVQGCTSLQSVIIRATTPPTRSGTPFYNVYSDYNWVIQVPASSVSAYQTAWTDLASRIQAIPT